MAESPTLEFVPIESWFEVAGRFRDYTFRQSPPYADRFAARQGAKSEYIAVRLGSEIVGAANVRIKKIPLLGGGIAYIGRGPVTRLGDLGDKDRLSACLTALRKEYVDRKGYVLRIQACLGPPEWNQSAMEAFSEQGFSTTNRANNYRTFLLDIDRPLEAIRSSLAKKWRYELTQSQKIDIATRFVTDEGSYRQFQAIFNEFVRAKGFLADPDADFLAPVEAALSDNEKLKIGVAEVEGRIVSGGLWGMVGDTALWVLGASTPEGLETRAAYRLQWEAIALAKELGIKWYDLGGINPVTNPGVYHFKKGLGGEDVTAPGPYQMIPASLRGRLTLAAEDLYRKLRRRE